MGEQDLGTQEHERLAGPGDRGLLQGAAQPLSQHHQLIKLRLQAG